MEVWIIIGIIFGTLILFANILDRIGNIKKRNAEKEQAILAQQQLVFDEKVLFAQYKQEVKESLDTLQKEKTQGFPWLATAIADYYENYDKIFAKYLESKKRPAFVQAEKIKEIAKEKKLFKREFLTTKYIIDYYETLFPWLREYVGFNSDELIKSIYKENLSEEEDPVSFYITKSEFENLSVTERNQRALDRYWNRDKDPWQIGRDYERYIGYLYEINGFKVQYHGIKKVKEDLGRDLICKKGNQIEIVQCKYWSSQKGIPIRENHVTQLYGTTIKYLLDCKRIDRTIQIDLFPELLKQSNILPVLVTTTELSDTAKDFAKVLGIRVDKIPMDNIYPCIKCNINFQTNEHIYHLPFDQQYDNTMICTTKGERWANTVKEAESYGFRRAWRWKPDKDTISDTI
ncbi:MAG: restriction endonuclease [Bacteroidales bacterium]|jgi:hypothetical protein